MSQESFITGSAVEYTGKRKDERGKSETIYKPTVSECFKFQQFKKIPSPLSSHLSTVNCQITQNKKKKEEKRKTAQKKPQNKYNNINLKSLVQFLSFFDNNNPNKRTKSK